MSWIVVEGAAARGRLGKLGDALYAAWRAGGRRRREELAARQLARMDDHLLRDIGIDRAGIDDAVAGAVAGGRED